MKSSLKKVKDCRVKLVVEVEAKRVENRYGEILRRFQKEAHISGFREGKAPPELVDRRFAKEIREEALKSLVAEAYYESVAVHKVSPMSLPAVSDIRFERGKNLSFTAEFDRGPEFSFKNYKGLRIEKVPSEVPPEDTEKGLHALRESKAELIPVGDARPVQKGDFIVADIEILREGRYVPGKKETLLLVEPNPADDFCDKVAGACVNEVREIAVEPTAEEKEKGFVGRKPLYKVWIRGLKEKRLPELDEAFAKNFGRDSVEELREAVYQDLARHRRDESTHRMKEQLFERLLALVSFPLPEGMVEKQKDRLLEQVRKRYAASGAEAQFEGDKQKMGEELARRARDQVKFYFILRKIAELEKIEMDEEELERKLNALSRESERPLEEVREVFEADLRESMLEAKTIEFLLANAKIEEKSEAGR